MLWLSRWKRAALGGILWPVLWFLICLPALLWFQLSQSCWVLTLLLFFVYSTGDFITEPQGMDCIWFLYIWWDSAWKWIPSIGQSLFNCLPKWYFSSTFYLHSMVGFTFLYVKEVYVEFFSPELRMMVWRAGKWLSGDFFFFFLFSGHSLSCFHHEESSVVPNLRSNNCDLMDGLKHYRFDRIRTIGWLLG